jgi:hypothetical protein
LTLLSDTASFAQKLRESFDEFRRTESLVREQYARDPDAASPTSDLLERATRRLLIDNFLRALDWNPDDPSCVTEEARARTQSEERLYFDYLGLQPQTRAPVLLFEAKGFDVALPRKPRGPQVDAREMSALIAQAVDAIKRGDTSLPVISAWAEFLRDMHTYIGSLDELGRVTLQRAVISAGGWIIVFHEPLAVFRSDRPANLDHIHCFISIDDILLRHGELYKLLHRTRLVDTLPLTLKVSEALEMIPGTQIAGCYRAVLVATSPSTGGRRQLYPTRAVYPALLIRSGDRWFAIVDYDHPIEEPKRTDRIDTFLSDLNASGAALEHRLTLRYGRAFDPLLVEKFPGFPEVRKHQDPVLGSIGPVTGSTADRRNAGRIERKICITHSGEPGAPAEFIVVTGTARFYKYDRQTGPVCPFHLWKNARGEHAAATQPHTGYVTNSFTEDGQDRHCAHDHLLKLRAERCHLRAIETHLCCQSCLFAADCWALPDDRERLPCPNEAVVTRALG